jgi:hypothetical protein
MNRGDRELRGGGNVGGNTNRQEAAQNARAQKVEDICIYLASKGFRSPADFFKEFFSNPKCNARQSGFYKKGGGFEDVLNMMLEDPRGGGSDQTPEPLTRWLHQRAACEVDSMINNKRLDTKLRYSKARGTMQNLSGFRTIVKKHCPLVWGLANHLATKEHLRTNSDDSTADDSEETEEEEFKLIPLTAIMSLVYARNQKVNAYQVLFAVFYYSHGLQKRAREILMKQGLMVSPSTSEVVMREMAQAVRQKLRERTRKVPQVISIDNVNQKVR